MNFNDPAEYDVKWTNVAQLFPEFVEWVVQKYGPLEGLTISEKQYTEYRQEFWKEGNK